MKKYEYKFIEIPLVSDKTEKSGYGYVQTRQPQVPFEACKEAIISEASNGWRLKQILEPRMSVYGANCYQVILERETE